MIQSIWEAFLSRFGRNEDDDEEGENSSFVPSPLDISVRSAHGGNDVEIERELTKIEEQADQLERKNGGN